MKNYQSLKSKYEHVIRALFSEREEDLYLWLEHSYDYAYPKHSDRQIRAEEVYVIPPMSSDYKIMPKCSHRKISGSDLDGNRMLASSCCNKMFDNSYLSLTEYTIDDLKCYLIFDSAILGPDVEIITKTEYMAAII